MSRTGYLIYHAAEGQRNKQFIEMLCRAGAPLGLQLRYVTGEEYRTLPLPDFVINRTRDESVSIAYEQRGIPVFHGSEVVRIGNDKAAAIQRLRENWLPDRQGKTDMPSIPDTLVISPKHSSHYETFYRTIGEWAEEMGLAGQQLVLKPVDGHGGKDVFLVGESDAQAIAACFPVLSGRKILCQQWIDCKGRDMRVYILGGKIYAAVLRQGRDDFRSNYSLGGAVSEYVLSEPQRREIMRYVQCLGGEKLALAGVDFLLDRQNRLVFNELEEMVGSRMLYACTNRDIVGDYVHWLAERQSWV